MAYLQRIFGPLFVSARTFTTGAKIRRLKTIHYAAQSEIDKICSDMIKDHNLSKNVWEDMQNNILKLDNVQPDNIDVLIMDSCLRQKNMDGAMSYYKFLQKNKHNIHITLTKKYFKACYMKGNELTNEEKIHALQEYDALRAKYEYLDKATIQDCVYMLLHTDRWKEAYELFKIAESASASYYSAIACTALSNREVDVGWSYILEALNAELQVGEKFFMQYFDYCEWDKDTFRNSIQKIFEIWKQYDIIPSEELTNKYMILCHNHGFSASRTQILPSQLCKVCSQRLTDLRLTEEEFTELSNAILKNILVGKDIYQSSTPRELAQFENFIEKAKPYDIVIDGLNVHFATKQKNSLLLTVNYFYKRNKVVLVIGRKHMRKLPEFMQIQSKAIVYLVDDWSKDDPYILYAAFKGGYNTRFVSKDLMRTQKYLLKTRRLKMFFKQWQLTRQYIVEHTKTGNNLINELLTVDSRVQRQGNCWHIPSRENIYQENFWWPDSWTCFKF